MTEPKKPRRGRGEGGLYYSEARQRWIAEATVGYTPAGKRITRKGTGLTKTAARTKLREVIRDYEDGLATVHSNATVAAAVTDWLDHGLGSTGESTRKNYRILADAHIVPELGERKLRALTATDVDRWLARKAKLLSTRTLRLLHSSLNRSVNRAMARDLVKRNVVSLCVVPHGQTGRPSKSLTLEQAKVVLRAAEGRSLHAYVVLSLLTGARTEELRALRWDHVDLVGDPLRDPPRPPAIQVWRSVRSGGDTKTRRSRRTLALPTRCVDALRDHRPGPLLVRAGDQLVFASRTGTELDAHNVRRAFRGVITAAGLEPGEWSPRELRHSFVSLLSDSGMPLEDIADLCGHSSMSVTESVYRHQLRPVLLGGAAAMDAIFEDDADA